MSRTEAQKRYEQAMIDADISGLPRDPEAEALVEQWTKEGVSHGEQLQRLLDRHKEPGENRIVITQDERLKRYEQAMISADIEGLPRDPVSEVLLERWWHDGVSTDEAIQRIKKLYQARAKASGTLYQED